MQEEEVTQKQVMEALSQRLLIFVRRVSIFKKIAGLSESLNVTVARLKFGHFQN